MSSQVFIILSVNKSKEELKTALAWFSPCTATTIFNSFPKYGFVLLVDSNEKSDADKILICWGLTSYGVSGGINFSGDPV